MDFETWWNLWGDVYNSEARTWARIAWNQQQETIDEMQKKINSISDVLTPPQGEEEEE